MVGHEQNTYITLEPCQCKGVLRTTAVNAVQWKRVDLLLEFRELLYISGTVEARKCKFGMRIDHEGLQQKRFQIRSKGVGGVT